MWSFKRSLSRSLITKNMHAPEHFQEMNSEFFSLTYLSNLVKLKENKIVLRKLHKKINE